MHSHCVMAPSQELVRDVLVHLPISSLEGSAVRAGAASSRINAVSTEGPPARGVPGTRETATMETSAAPPPWGPWSVGRGRRYPNTRASESNGTAVAVTAYFDCHVMRATREPGRRWDSSGRGTSEAGVSERLLLRKRRWSGDPEPRKRWTGNRAKTQRELRAEGAACSPHFRRGDRTFPQRFPVGAILTPGAHVSMSGDR